MRSGAGAARRRAHARAEARSEANREARVAKPPAPLPTDICEAGTFCNVDCAQKYANFDAAKGCANAAKGYCCEDTKPANYPFKPAA